MKEKGKTLSPDKAIDYIIDFIESQSSSVIKGQQDFTLVGIDDKNVRASVSIALSYLTALGYIKSHRERYTKGCYPTSHHTTYRVFPNTVRELRRRRKEIT